MKLKNIASALVAAAAMAGSDLASASAITTGQWYFFGFGASNTPLTGSTADTYDSGPISGLGTPDGTWTITLTGNAELFWTDLQISGDRFEFYNGTTLLGVSGLDDAFGSSKGTDIAAALADTNYGKGSVVLGPGSYSLNGQFLGVVGSGDGAFIVRAIPETTVPEPTTLALAGLALAGLGVSRRRRGQQSAR